MDGWISIHRQIEESEVWFGDKFNRAHAWIDLLLLASHKPHTFFVRGIEIKVERGQLAHSQLTLAKRWKWNFKTVVTYLKWLENRKMVETKTNNITTIITILNYNKYQNAETKTETKTESKRRPERRHTIRDNNGNNENKENKDAYGEFQNVLLSSMELQKLKDAFKDRTEEMIENISRYLASKGDKYKSHYATILSWERKNNPKQETTPNSDICSFCGTDKWKALFNEPDGGKICERCESEKRTTVPQ